MNNYVQRSEEVINRVDRIAVVNISQRDIKYKPVQLLDVKRRY